MDRLKIGLFNDSFPPTIDGVAQAVRNYASVLQKKYSDVTVVTPRYKGVVDEYPFDVFRYPSFPLPKRAGYRAGNFLSPLSIKRLRDKKFDLIHIHTPMASSLLAKNINWRPQVPMVLTYHTKFDIDLAKRVGWGPLCKVLTRAIRHNLNVVDEVWVVSEGCGQSLRTIGYYGNYRVMENGTDFVFGQAAAADVENLRAQYQIADDDFVFLFVGRMMWYKNTGIILEMLKKAREQGMKFRAFMIGDGYDAPAIRAKSKELALADCVTFTGPIYDRELLRVYYSMSDMFLFPSTYDTSGLVVKEAAACSCPSLLIENSCASEGIKHGHNGFLAAENAAACCDVLLDACSNRSHLAEVGRHAGEELYLSWETVVSRAHDRYLEILNKK